jgi:hypothetical protein
VWARLAATLALAALAVPPLAAAQAPRGDPRSRIPDGGNASEYWDLVAQFESAHVLVARFMITHEGPGENTAIAYGHFIEPDGTVWPWINGHREGHWDLKSDGRVVDVGSSDLYLTGPPYRLRVKKRKKGVKIDLRITPDGPPAWDRGGDAEVDVDLLASGAAIAGTVWFRGMPEPLALEGRGGLTHTWMARSEPALALRRIDFFSLHGDTLVYLRDLETPSGTRERWLRIARHGKTLYENSDFALDGAGKSAAQRDSEYPLPGTLAVSGPKLAGAITLGAGLLHHDPMEVIPQPFRFLLSFKMRPQRVWTESPFEFSYTPGTDPVRLRGSGITIVTYLNPAPPPAP